MTITFKVGDLLAADEIAIAHGCNTQGMMGAGVARLIRDMHPDVYAEYKTACASYQFKIGTAQAVWADPALSGGVDRIVYNLGTQRLPGANATLWGVFLSFANMAEDARVRGIEAIGIPRIGCGIGGLRWTAVEPVIVAAISQSTHPDLNIVVYDLEAS